MTEPLSGGALRHAILTGNDTPPEPAAPRGIDPKRGAGAAKVPFATLPWAVIAEMAVGMGEGAAKYGAHNWRRTDVLTSTYVAAAMRHLVAFTLGEDTDPDSGDMQSHITKALTSLAVLRDAQLHGNAVDDRPPASPPGHFDRLNEATVAVAARVAATRESPVACAAAATV